MNIRVIFNGIRTRLPWGKRFRVIIKCIQLHKANPNIAFYKQQILLNIKSYFRIKPQYGIMMFERVNADIPARLYHMTEIEYLTGIKQKGLCNEKTHMVFLTDSDKYISYVVKKRNFRNPVLLRIDAERMQITIIKEPDAKTQSR